MKGMRLCLILVQKALNFYTFNNFHGDLKSLFLLVFPHVANFRYVANLDILLYIY